MADYRVYRLTGGRITEPPQIIICDTDDEAIQKTAQLRNGTDIELWDSARFIVCFSAVHK